MTKKILPKHKQEKNFETKTVSILGEKRLAHQTCESGWSSFLHRIVILDAEDSVIAAGAPSCYQHPAFFEYDGEIYLATTEYYHGEPLPKETVVRIAKDGEGMATKNVRKTFKNRLDDLMHTATKADIMDAYLIVMMLKSKKMIGAKKDFAEAFLRTKDRLDDDFEDFLKLLES